MKTICFFHSCEYLQQHGLLILDSKITGDWKYIMSEVTDKHGRITYNLPPEHSVGYGLYPVRMVVRGDHSCLHMTLACLPPKTETVRQTNFKKAVFSNLLNFKFAVLCQ